VVKKFLAMVLQKRSGERQKVRPPEERRQLISPPLTETSLAREKNSRCRGKRVEACADNPA